MKNLRILLMIFMGVSLAVATSCKKDDDTDDNNDDNNDPVTETCYVVKMDYGSDYDEITYNPSNMITKLENFDSTGTASDGYSNFTYENDLLVTMESYNNGNLESKMEIIYNSNNKPDTLNLYTNATGSLNKVGYFKYSFNGDQLSSISMFAEAMGNIIEVSKTDFQFVGNNVSKITQYEFNFSSMSLELSETRDFTYDDKKNAFIGIGLDYFMGEVQFLSENNVASVTVKDDQGSVMNDRSYNFTYEYNSNDYPTKQTQTSFDNSDTEVTLYEYSCE